MKRSIGLTRAASMQRGLARIDAPQGMIVAYATQAGATAADGTDRNSPYTQAFLRHIETQEEIGTIFRRISAEVYDATKHAQLPELSLSLIGEFYLSGPPAAAPANSGPSAAERAWAEVKDTKNPALLKEFVSRFRRQLLRSARAQSNGRAAEYADNLDRPVRIAASCGTVQQRSRIGFMVLARTATVVRGRGMCP